MRRRGSARPPGGQRVALDVADLNVLDRMPLLDVKPRVPRFDTWAGRAGWLDDAPPGGARDDGRFEDDGGPRG
jgi:tRNA (Thr-GGU) A37 N-methylase